MAKKKRKMSALQARYFGKRKRNSPRRRKATAHAAAPRRRRRNPVKAVSHRRRRRRNPPVFSIGGLIQQATQGVVDGALVVGGKALARLASAQFSYADGSMMDTLIEVSAALVLGMVGPRIVGADRARFLMAGAFGSPIETLVSQAGIPHISPLLGAGPFPLSTSMYLNAADAAGINGGMMGRRIAGYGPRNGAALSAGVQLVQGMGGYSRASRGAGVLQN